MTDEPRWLSPEERRAWRPFAALLLQLPAALDADLQRESQISHFEYLVLAALSEAPEHTVRLSDLAVIVGGSLSRISHVAARLERRGSLHREPCPSDRRATNAVLTGDGLAALRAAAPGHVASVRRLVFDALTPDQVDQLADVAAAMGEAVDPDGLRRAFPGD